MNSEGRDMAKRMLVLSVTAGAGHVRAAQGVEAAFRERYPEAEVWNADALRYTNPAFRKAMSEGYERFVRELPSVWGYVYDKLEAKPSGSKLKRTVAFFDRLNSQPLVRMVNDFDPDVVVCTHFVPAEVLGQRRLKGKLRAPVSVVLTDYDIHTMWIQDGVDRYFVATDEMAYALRVKGVDHADVVVSGLPVLPAFAKAYPGRREMRRRLGLKPEAPAVLLSAGGFGMMRVDQAVAILAERLPDVQWLAVAGRNEALHRRLERVAAESRGTIVPFGFVDNMHELMAACDLAVAKSGGLTTSECLAMGVPLVVFNPIPGQEERNAVFLLERGAGLWAHTPANMVYKVETLLKDRARLESMQQNARRAGKPEAAYTIAKTAMGDEGMRSARDVGSAARIHE